MEKLSTKRLLAYKKKHLEKYKFRFRYVIAPYTEEEWKTARKNIKEILATREHIER